MSFVVAVAVVVVDGDRVLSLRRARDRDVGAGLWETVSGRVDPDEPLEAACLREVREETGLEVALEPQPVDAYVARRGPAPMCVVVYRARRLGGEVVRSAEHDAHAWLTPQELRARGAPERLCDAVDRALGRRARREGACFLSTQLRAGPYDEGLARGPESEGGMPKKGTQIDRYDVWGRIGQGGMSEVWLAKHVGLGTPVVLKTLKPELGAATGRDPRERMLAEARLMARVTSPHVVRAIDTGELDGTPFIAQEYVDGIDLAELDRRRRAALGVGLPLWFVAEVVEQTCEALLAAHRVGVIHRDVKPSNLFATPEGVRLGDFGIAVEGASSGSAEVSGTLKFMAPELLQGRPPTRAADVYSLGATAFDLRYGTAPFASYADVRDPRVRPPFPAPHTAAESYFQHLVARALAKDPEARPSDPRPIQRHVRRLRRVLDAEVLSRTFVAVGPNAFRYGTCEVSLEVGDIARSQADAIVSSANYQMTMRTGVGDALRRAGGDEIEAMAMAGGERELGACVVTRAGRLRAKHIIHAVSAWNETSVVGRSVHRALLVAEELGVRELAMCALGTGVARVTMETCANAMMSALRFHLQLGASRLSRVTVVLADDDKLKTFREVTLDALHVMRETDSDVGLASAETPVAPDAATCIGESSYAQNLAARGTQ